MLATFFMIPAAPSVAYARVCKFVYSYESGKMGVCMHRTHPKRENENIPWKSQRPEQLPPPAGLSAFLVLIHIIIPSDSSLFFPRSFLKV